MILGAVHTTAESINNADSAINTGGYITTNNCINRPQEVLNQNSASFMYVFALPGNRIMQVLFHSMGGGSFLCYFRLRAGYFLSWNKLQTTKVD